VIDLVLGIGLPAVLLTLGICVGGYRERRHIKGLERREAATGHVLINNLKRVTDLPGVRRAALVGGEVVIATDYFKSYATALRNLVGGEMRAAQALLGRARREAILRMVEEAQALGADEVWNVRLSSSNIRQLSRNKGAMAVEVYAYGTAVVRR
jgi:uncharacterized protein YbjQ (UPF0145 family)